MALRAANRERIMALRRRVMNNKKWLCGRRVMNNKKRDVRRDWKPVRRQRRR